MSDLTIAELRSFVVDDNSEHLAEVIDKDGTVAFGHNFRVRDVPREFDAGGCLVRMLPARAARGGEPFGELGIGDDEGGANGDGHGPSLGSGAEVIASRGDLLAAGGVELCSGGSKVGDWSTVLAEVLVVVPGAKQFVEVGEFFRAHVDIMTVVARHLAPFRLAVDG